ncbi:hypothetical protein BGW37DRAFT_554680 [Umbelopsis sp. PMI_123]|nr:hypothetical protein BGW37DRAFT_554680 [Umbelopsis sp. PMI_123]
MTPESQKTYAQQGKEAMTDSVDNMKADMTPEPHKSAHQRAIDQFHQFKANHQGTIDQFMANHQGTFDYVKSRVSKDGRKDFIQAAKEKIGLE